MGIWYFPSVTMREFVWLDQMRAEYRERGDVMFFGTPQDVFASLYSHGLIVKLAEGERTKHGYKYELSEAAINGWYHQEEITLE